MVVPLLARASEKFSSYHYFPQIGSTNDAAKELARGSAGEIAVVVADCQTQGRGRSGRRWISEPGRGLWVSLLIRPNLSHWQAGVLSLGAAVAVAKALRLHCGQGQVALKWPNDVVAYQRKLAGILVEGGGATQVNWAVVGIGINTGRFPELKETIGRQVTSVEEIAGKPVSRAELLADLVAAFADVYALIKAAPTQVLTEFSSQCETMGQQIMWREVHGAEEITNRGLAVGLDDTGALLVQTVGDQRIRPLRASEVALVRPERD